MASLNLIPDPTVVVVQTGIFLANIVIIKKLLVEPYLKVRDRRDLLTVGSKGDADRALRDAEAAQQKISQQITKASQEARHERESIRSVATAKRQEIISKAERDAKAVVANVEQQIKDELARESAKIPAIVANLTEEVYRTALA